MRNPIREHFGQVSGSKFVQNSKPATFAAGFPSGVVRLLQVILCNFKYLCSALGKIYMIL